MPPALEGEVLTTGPPGKSLDLTLELGLELMAGVGRLGFEGD